MRPFGALIERKVGDITREYERRLAPGFPVRIVDPAFGLLLDDSLQIAREVDRTNWLIVQGICEEGVAAALGDVPDLIFIRSSSNVNYFMSFNEALVVIRALRGWGLLAWANWGRLKDAARAVARREELELIDLSEGWP